MVEGVGFEPTKAEPADLQSDPFGRSGTPPREISRRDHRKINFEGQSISVNFYI